MINLTQGQEWFEGHRPLWDSVIKPIFSRREYCRAVEIGTWEGGSACWILENLCIGGDERNQIVCVDHFDLMKTASGRRRWSVFQANIQSTGLADRVRVIPQFSTPALFKIMNELIDRKEDGYNLVYIDGSHRADDTLLDAEMAWRISTREGIIVFDDYEWDKEIPGTIQHPQSGIDGFLLMHSGEYALLHKGYQVIIQKKTPMRLGFSYAHKSIR